MRKSLKNDVKMPLPAFSTAQVADMTGLSVRQLDYWARQGIFSPELQHANGSGTRKRYSLGDVVQLRSLRRLHCYRWPTQKLRRAIEMLRGVIHDPNPLRQATLIADRNTLLAIYGTKRGEQLLLDGLKAGGQHVLSLVIEAVEAETRQLILQYTSQDNHDE